MGGGALTVQLEERFGVELLRVESVRFLPDLPQLSHAALNTAQETRQGASRRLPSERRCGDWCPDWSVDFGVLPVFLLQLLQSPLLPLPLLLVQALQVLPPLVLLQHLVAFELLVSLSVVVLQVLGSLDTEPDFSWHLNQSAHRYYV